MREPSEKQKDLARSLFFNSADDDYICARIAIRYAIYRNFAWNAGQCLEKYTKCLCLLRGQTAKFDHNFLGHLQKFVLEVDPSLFPTQLDISAFTKVRAEFADVAKEPFLDCLSRFQKNGNTKGRYRTSENRILPYDLQKLDLIVFLLRRVCVPSPKTEDASSTHEDRLRSDHFYTTATIWPTILRSSATGQQKLEGLMFENSVNFPEKFAQSRGVTYSAFDSAPQNAMEIVGRLTDEDRKWLSDHVKL